MKKGLLISLFTLSVIASTGCGPTQDLSLLPVNSDNVSSYSTRADWYENLRPDLKAYYEPAKGKTGADLFEALHNIISENNKISGYGDSKSFMYATADNTTLNSKTGIFDAYSNVFVTGSGGNGDSYKEQGDANKDGAANDFINCEHTWPQSFFNKSLPMVADIHHLQSTLSVPNNRRGHFPFGMATGSIIYSNNGGAKLSSGSNKFTNSILLKQTFDKIANMDEATITGNIDAVFEPGDYQKGNTARAMLYFYTRYYDQNIRSGEFQKEKFWSSKVPTFIQWSSKIDPVNEQDIKRNDIIFKKQGNRNPFVDVPEFVNLIGEKVFISK